MYFINSYYFCNFFFVKQFIKFIFKNIKGCYKQKCHKIDISLKGHSYHFFALKKLFSLISLDLKCTFIWFYLFLDLKLSVTFRFVVYENALKIDFLIYITKMYLFFWSPIRLKFQG